MNNQSKSNNENGNILFLVLIAVALFAALSYAVTSSSRSGGGDVSNERNKISTSILTQYTSDVRTAVTRIMLSNGLEVQDLEFNKYRDVRDCDPPAQCPFHPQGGGASYVPVPPSLLASDSADGEWWFTMNYEISALGSSVSGSFDGNDLLMIVPQVSKEICDKLHEELGLSAVETIPITSSNIKSTGSISNSDAEMAEGWQPLAAEIEFGAGGYADNIAGQPQACFLSSDSIYHYYSAVLER